MGSNCVLRDGIIAPVIDRVTFSLKMQISIWRYLLDLLLYIQVATVARKYILSFGMPTMSSLNLRDLATVTQGWVLSRVYYCNAFFMALSFKTVWKLYLVQNAESQARESDQQCQRQRRGQRA